MRKTLALAALATSLTWAGAAADDDTIQLEDYLDYESVSNPQISPDGSQIIYSRRAVDKMKDRFRSSLWLINSDGTRNRELLTGGGARWSPDGTRIAYSARGDDGKPQIHVRWMDAEGNVTQATHSQLAPRGHFWSPDSKYLAFVARVPHESDFKIELPGKPAGAEWTEDPPVIETFHYRQDRVGLTNQGYDHLFIVPAEGGTARQITDGEWNVGARGLGAIAGGANLSWSPDGTKIAFDGLASDDYEMRYFETQINIVDVATGDIQRLTGDGGAYSNPRFSPDGKYLAFVGNAARDRAYPVPELLVADLESGEIRTILRDLPDGPRSLTWANDSSGIYFGMGAYGHRNIHFASLDGNMRDITEGPQLIGLSSQSRDGMAVGVYSTATQTPDIVRYDLSDASDITQITHVNDDIFGDVTFGAVEEIWYDSTEDTRVHGWIMTPPNFDPSKKYPLVLQIHGGPHGMYTPGFNFAFQEYAAAGYVVVFTNPRGSTGYGNDFANAIQHAYPGPRDYADLMAGVDEALRRDYVDQDRMFVTGCSGGGILTSYVIGQTNRFKAAVARCTVSNWISFAGTADVSGWIYTLFPKPFWEDPAPWLEHSTIMHVGKVETPTLLMTGDRDLRTPIPQAEEFYAALKQRGIPTKLLPMRGEFHGTGAIPSNFMRTQLYTRKWFDEYGGAEVEGDFADQ